MELVIVIEALASVPLALVDADLFAGMHGEAVIRQVIGRIGKDHVDGVVRKQGEKGQAVIVEKRYTLLLEIGFGLNCNRPRRVGLQHRVGQV